MSISVTPILRHALTFERPRLDHSALLYSSYEELLMFVSSFVADGLRNGESVVVVADDQQSALLREGLGAHGHPPGTSVSFVTSFSRCVPPTLTIASYRRVLDAQFASGAKRTRLIGQLEPGSSPHEHRAWMCVESVLNSAFAATPVSLLCPYDTRSHSDEVLAAVERTHPNVSTSVGPRVSACYENPDDTIRSLQVDRLPIEETLPRLDVQFDRVKGVPRAAVRMAAEPAGLSPERLGDLVLAFSEVATNALVHGRGVTGVRVWAEPGLAVCTVTDEGTSFDDPLAGYVPPTRSRTKAGGLGLWVSRQLCDELDLIRGEKGLAVRLVMRG